MNEAITYVAVLTETGFTSNYSIETGFSQDGEGSYMLFYSSINVRKGISGPLSVSDISGIQAEVFALTCSG